MRRRHRRLGRRRRRRPRRSWPRPGSTSSCSRRAPLQPRQLPGGPARGDRRALPRRRPDDRRRAARRSRSRSARAVGGTTVINSGTCFRAPDAGARASWRERARDRLGERARRRLRRGRGVPPGHAARPRADGPQRPAGDGGRRGARRQRRPDLPQRRQLRPVQLLPLRLRDRRQARRCTSATCRAPSPPGRGCGPGSKRTRVLVEDGRAAGVALHWLGANGNGRRRAYTVRARRAVIVAGGALGTPELLLRSGPRRRARSAATSTSTPPAGSAPATRRRCAAGTA